MSINTPGAAIVDNSQASANTSSHGQGTSNASAPLNQNWSFHDKGRFGRAPLGRGMGTEGLKTIMAALIEEFKAAESDYEIALLPLDNANESAYYSEIIVCMRQKASGRDAVAFHTLILESTGEPLSATNTVIQGNNVEVIRVPGDADDEQLHAMVIAKVRQQYPSAEHYKAGTAVVPRSFNVEDKAAVHALALNAGLACATELETRRPEFRDVNLTGQAHDSKLSVSLSFSNNQATDAVSKPVRADIGIAFTAQAHNAKQANQSLNSEDRAARISTITAFTDIVYAPVAPQQNGMYGAFQQQPYGAPPATQLYAARLVITSMENQFTNSVAAQLLNLLVAQSVAADGNWMQSFRPTPQAGRKQNLRDIGALGVEIMGADGGFGKRIDTTGDSFRPENLGQLIYMLFRPGLMLSIDVSECGPDTWFTQIFGAGAQGDPAAYEAIYNAANTLSGSHFAKLFPKGTPMFTDLNNRIHLGQYTDETGEIRDIRDIGYVAVASLSQNDPQTIRDFSDTFTQVQYPLATRMAARKRIIQGFLPTAEFTGFASRVTFTSAFTSALAQACQQAGLAMTITSPLNAGDLNNARGVANYAMDALSPMQAAPIFAQDMGNFAPGAQNGFNRFGAWSR